jgi:transposase
MSLRPQPGYEIPDETQRVARAAFPKGTLCLRIADAVGALYDDTQFAGLFPLRGQPAEAPARLALATVLQFIEGLSNRRGRRGAGPHRLEVCAGIGTDGPGL